jgi:multiple sugar transport system permease protein
VLTEGFRLILVGLCVFLTWRLVTAGVQLWQLVRPALSVLFVFTVIPLSLTLFFSLFGIAGVNLRSPPWPFVALSNYAATLTNQDDLLACYRSVVFSLVAVALELVLGFAGGLLLRVSSAGYLLRSLLVIPVVMPSLIAGMLWRSMFDSGFGLINRLADMIGLPPVTVLALGEGGTTLFPRGLLAPLVAEVWQWTPFVVLVVSLALAQEPRALRDWVRSQGTSSLRSLLHVSLPQLAPVLGVVAGLRFIDCLKVFDVVWAMYGNNVETATVSVRLSGYALEIRDLGVGSALSMLFLLALACLTFLLAWPVMKPILMRREGGHT